MIINKICSVYYSPTGTTKTVTEALAGAVAAALALPCGSFDFTLPAQRGDYPEFSSRDLVIFGVPVYAGRVPNLLLKYLGGFSGNGAFAVPVVVYGNRDFDDALIELRDILSENGFITFAAAAFIGEHAFSRTLGAGRPDESDLHDISKCAERIADTVRSVSNEECIARAPVQVTGVPKPYRGYYVPRDREGTAIDIRKVKPLTNENCVKCGLCASICPMGAISFENPGDVTGTCTKCGACIKRCPIGAKYYNDENYLYHKTELEAMYTARKNPEFYYRSDSL